MPPRCSATRNGVTSRVQRNCTRIIDSLVGHRYHRSHGIVSSMIFIPPRQTRANTHPRKIKKGCSSYPLFSVHYFRFFLPPPHSCKTPIFNSAELYSAFIIAFLSAPFAEPCLSITFTFKPVASFTGRYTRGVSNLTPLCIVLDSSGFRTEFDEYECYSVQLGLTSLKVIYWKSSTSSDEMGMMFLKIDLSGSRV